MESKTTPEQVSQRLKDQFTPAYLTLTSIIQGVALSALVVRVDSSYPQFTATDWLLAIATFIAILAVWNEYVMLVLAFVWVPNLLDSAIPFAFLAGELFAIHFAYHEILVSRDQLRGAPDGGPTERPPAGIDRSRSPGPEQMRTGDQRTNGSAPARASVASRGPASLVQ